MSDREAIIGAVKSKYGEIAGATGTTCGNSSTCCDNDVADMGTSCAHDEIRTIRATASMGLGCGNPTALADIKSGEFVVHLGAGAGCFLAAKRVGERGFVVGVNMTEAMLDRARENARKGGYGNVEFRLGEIEDLPVEGSSVDLVISNCVVNLSPDKSRVFQEICRVLKPGGRFIVSDVVSKGAIPPNVREDMEQWAGCIAGALEKSEYLRIAREAGLEGVAIRSEVDYDYLKTDQYSMASVTVAGYKPNHNGRH